ncbi:hypothetical protein B296_00047516 [Ensete ventricosum]|uniref:Uncharacterized protein n=1 Tax=Ensete ventricosum TaxID=4639 RepID=A0A426XAA9_ENSVE|nr:hypothetical protein B296_00047516 [Ensete ventricosum]
MDTHKSFTLSFSNQSVQQRQLEESFRSTVDAAVSPMTDPKLARSLLSNAYAMEQLILCSRSNKRRFMASGLRDDAKTRSHPYPSRRQAPSNHRFALLVSRLQQAVTISHHTMSKQGSAGHVPRDNPLRGPSIGK